MEEGLECLVVEVPPRNGGEMPITPLWQQQIAKADVSRAREDVC